MEDFLTVKLAASKQAYCHYQYHFAYKWTHRAASADLAYMNTAASEEEELADPNFGSKFVTSRAFFRDFLLMVLFINQWR